MSIYGDRLYGRIDKVPGLFFVGTLFFHVNLIPLFPKGTFLVTQERDQRFSGVAIPSSGKSILMAYGTGLLVGIWVFAALCTALVMYSPRDDGNPYIPGTIAGAAFLVWVVFMILSFQQKASYTRACELGMIAKLSSAGWEKLNAQFGRSGPGPQS